MTTVNPENVWFCGCGHTRPPWEQRWSSHPRLHLSMPKAHVPVLNDRTDRCVLLPDCFLHGQDQGLPAMSAPRALSFPGFTQCWRAQSSNLATQLLGSVWVNSFLFAFPPINNTTHLLINQLCIFSSLLSFSVLNIVNQDRESK